MILTDGTIISAPCQRIMCNSNKTSVFREYVDRDIRVMLQCFECGTLFMWKEAKITVSIDPARSYVIHQSGWKIVEALCAG